MLRVSNSTYCEEDYLVLCKLFNNVDIDRGADLAEW